MLAARPAIRGVHPLARGTDLKGRNPHGLGPSARPRSSTVVTAAVLWLSVLALALLGPSRDLLLPSLLAYSFGFAALLRLWRHDLDFLDDPRILLGGAVLLRLTLFPALPDLSDDLYRYVWDGWLSVSGVNPFRFIPAAPELARFQDSDLFSAINSPDYHSIYPPLSQIVFLAGGGVYEWAGWPAAAFAVKAVFILMEITGLAFLFGAVRAMGIRPGMLALYALNPLVLITLTAGGHSESGLILGFGMMAYGIAQRKQKLSWLGLVLAGAAKGIPFLLGPLLLRRQWEETGPRKTLGAAAPAFFLGLALLAPFYFPGVVQAVGSSADLYVRLFEFNAGLYFALKEAGLWLTGADWGKTIGPILRGIFLAGAAWGWLRWPIRREEGFFRASLAVLGLYLLTATTVHPWYLTWGLAFVPFTPFLRGAWVWASWAAFLTYFVYVGVPQGLSATVFWSGIGIFLLVEGEGAVRDRLLRMAGHRKARQIAPHLKGGLILDLGAGEGYVARVLRRGERRFLLIDVGPFFRVKIPGAVYDGLDLPLLDRSVDTVLLSLALHHAEDPDRVIAEALRVARERVVVTESTYRWGWERRLLEIADRWANRTRGMTGSESGNETLRFRTVRDWEAAFRDEGAVVLRSGRLNIVGHRHHLFVVERPAPRQRDSEGGEPPEQLGSEPG